MAKRLYRSGEFTISGFIAQKYGNTAKLVVSAIMIYALFIVNVGNYVSGAAAIATVMRVNLPTAALITAIVSTLYYAYGGLKSVAYVTILHSAMKLLGIAILVWVAWSMTGGMSAMIHAMPAHYFTWNGTLSGSKIGAWVIGTAGAIFSTQFIIQAISGAKSANDARNSTLIAAALCVPIALALGFVGISAKFLFPNMTSLYALPIFLQHMHPLLSGVVTVSLVASIFVSVSTAALAIASLIVKDFYAPRHRPTPERELKVTRAISFAVGFVPLIFVLFVPQILALSFFTRALRLSVTVVALIGIYLPFFSSNRGARRQALARVHGAAFRASEHLDRQAPHIERQRPNVGPHRHALRQARHVRSPADRPTASTGVNLARSSCPTTIRRFNSPRSPTVILPSSSTTAARRTAPGGERRFTTISRTPRTAGRCARRRPPREARHFGARREHR